MFTNRPTADGSTTQVLLAIDVGSRSKVDEIMKIALENGAAHYLEPEDMGWTPTGLWTPMATNRKSYGQTNRSYRKK